MFSQQRMRRGPYAMAAPSPVPALVRTGVLVLLVTVCLFFIGRWILQLFGAGNQRQRTAVVLMVEPRGSVNVSLEGGAIQRAEDTLKLYDGDRVSAGGNGHATLLFFDGTQMRLDQQTDVTVTRSEHGSLSSTIDIALTRGSLFIATPSAAAFSGSIVRTVHTPVLTLTLPAAATVRAGQRSLAVFAASGLGVTVTVHGTAVTIGEGQEFALPESGGLASDLYTYRTVLKDATLSSSFVVDSRNLLSKRGATRASESSGALVTDLLSVTAPADNVVIAGSTVIVTGTIGTGVQSVRVNGYQAVIDPAKHTFREELALSAAAQTDVRIEALDAHGLVLQEIHRTVKRDVQVPDAPVILKPAHTGETWRTQRTELSVSGTAKADVVGIIVNDYRLQLFVPGSGTWSYLASTKLGNLVPGRNVITVVAIDAAGNRSTPAVLTLLLEEGAEGVVAGSDSASTSSTPSQTELPKNAPLKPGSLLVTGPTAGTHHTATGSEIVIQGTTDSATAHIWVNDYRLQLYRTGRTTWNTIASTTLGNMKKGTNTYVITARDAKDMILDQVTYEVTY